MSFAMTENGHRHTVPIENHPDHLEGTTLEVPCAPGAVESTGPTAVPLTGTTTPLISGTKRSSEDTDDNDMERRRRRTASPQASVDTVTKRSRPSQRSATQPRWHNQSYMLFLALRQHPDRCLPRTELIKAAVALDMKISKERNLPRVFRGKTPMNSASAVLTNNSDRYFIAFRPEGSRSMHFRLAYEPGNFQKAVAEYKKWVQKLAEHDWPYCFGVPKPKPAQESQMEANAPLTGQLQEQDTLPSLSPPTSTDKPSSPAPAPSVLAPARSALPAESRPAHNSEHQDTDVYPATAAMTTTMVPVIEDTISLEDLDVSNVPKSWTDILRVGPSTIPGAGNGLFATRKLPYNTPLGFYFGVPMTEDEFDSLKDRVGRASEYSIMYRKTVLDATNDEGQPWDDPDGPMFCPFHFMNESSEAHANIAFVEGAVVNQVICWTKRNIKEGEELFVWYGRDVDRHWVSPAPSVTAPTSPALHTANSEDGADGVSSGTPAPSVSSEPSPRSPTLPTTPSLPKHHE